MQPYVSKILPHFKKHETPHTTNLLFNIHNYDQESRTKRKLLGNTNMLVSFYILLNIYTFVILSRVNFFQLTTISLESKKN